MNDLRPPQEDPRVRFAAERTLLAWIRTGLAMMGFGFVVARFGLFLREIAAVGHIATNSHTTGWSLGVGVALICLGVAVSLAASLEFYRFVRLTEQGKAYAPRTVMLAVGVGAVLAGLGVVMAIYLVVVSL